MSDDFKVGDVVIRVSGESCFDEIPIGATRRVSAIFWWDGDDEPGLALEFLGHPPDDPWYADCFRKLPPADPDFIKLIREIKPAKELEDA